MDKIHNFAALMLGKKEPSFQEAIAALRGLRVTDLTQPEMLHRHVLGFIQARIATLNGRELRIHHWPTSARFSEEPHTHLWSLTSYVLAGSMTCTEYSVEPSERPTQHQLFSVKQLTSGTAREPMGQNIKVSPLSRVNYATGSTYMVPQGTYHTSEPTLDSALTMITTSQALAPRPQVAVSRSAGSDRLGYAPMTPPTDIDISSFRDALERAMS